MPLLLHTVALLIYLLRLQKSHFQFKYIPTSKVLILCSHEENVMYLYNWTEENIARNFKGYKFKSKEENKVSLEIFFFVLLGREGQRGESCEGEEEDFDRRLWNTYQLLSLVNSSIPNNTPRRPTSFSSPWWGRVYRKRVPHADVAFYPCNINWDLSWHFYQEWGDKIPPFRYSYLISWIFQHKQKAQSTLFLRSTTVKLL